MYRDGVDLVLPCEAGSAALSNIDGAAFGRDT